MIKILDIATTSQGAYRLLRLRVSEINKDSEYSNTIICPPGSEVELMQELGIPVHPINMSRGLNPLLLPLEIRRLVKVFKKLKPDIIHSHNSKAGGISRLAAYLYNKKNPNKIIVLHQVHGFVFNKYSGIKRKFFVLMEKYLSQLTDYLLFQNSNDLNFSQENSFGKAAQLIKIGNGVSFSELKKLPVSNNIDNLKIIVCVARLEPVKNQTMLIKSLAILKEKFEYDKFQCVFIGEGESDKYLELVKQLSLSENVIFTGKVSRDDIVQYYNKADLNVLTSLSEGMPRALMEAIYMGVPSIGTRVVGTTEVIKPGISGEFVELGDVESLAGLMYDLLTDESRRQKLIWTAQKYAEEHFDEKKVIQRLKGIYIDSLR